MLTAGLCFNYLPKGMGMPDLAALRFSDDAPTQRSCGLRAALNIVAGRWKPLILWHLLSGPRRFGQLRRDVGHVSEKVFLTQLQELARDGIVARTVISDRPLAVEYALTELGATLAPSLAVLSHWGFTHVIGSAQTDNPASNQGRPSPLEVEPVPDQAA